MMMVVVMMTSAPAVPPLFQRKSNNSYSVEENLEPTMAWLQNRMHLDQKVRVVAALVDFVVVVVGDSHDSVMIDRLWRM